MNSTIFHVGHTSVQNMKSDINRPASYSLDCHVQLFVQTLTEALGESSIHVLSLDLLPHASCCLIFSLKSVYDCLNNTYQLPLKLEPATSKRKLQCELNLLGIC